MKKITFNSKGSSYSLERGGYTLDLLGRGSFSLNTNTSLKFRKIIPENVRQEHVVVEHFPSVLSAILLQLLLFDNTMFSPLTTLL